MLALNFCSCSFLYDIIESMDNRGRNEKSKLEMRWARIVLPIIISLGLLIILFYYQFERISLNMLERMNRDFLNQSESIFSYINDIVKVTTNHIINDGDIRVLLYNPDPEEGEIIRGTRALEDISGYGSTIQSVYIYNAEKDYFYTTSSIPGGWSSDFHDQGVMELFSSPSSGPHYRYMAKAYSRGLIDVNTYLFAEYDRAGAVADAVVININSNWIDKILSKMFPEVSVMVLNEQGRVIGKTIEINREKRQSIERLIRTRTSDAGRFVVGTFPDKEIYLYSSFGPDWCIVRRIAWSDIFNELEIMKAFSYTGIVAAVITVALFGLMNTLRYFRPLKRIEESIKTSSVGEENTTVTESVDRLILVSNEYEKNYHEQIREEYMRQLLERERETSHAQDELRLYISPLDSSRPFRLLLFSSDTKAAMDEMALILGCSVFIRMREHRGLFFFQREDDVPNFVGPKAEEYGLSWSVSGDIEWGENIHLRYERVRETLSYAVFPECGENIHSENILKDKYSVLPSRYNRESAILLALSGGNLETSLGLYREYMTSLSLCRISYIVFLLKRLYMASAVNPKAVDDTVMGEIEYIFSLSLDRKRLDEIFFTSFSRKVESVLESRNTRVGSMVNEIKKYIEENYRNTALSLQMVADRLEMNSVYVGKLFRSECGFSVADYINRCRLHRARELLRDTDKTVREIAGLAGIPNVQYFYTLFRNDTGKSPNEWRNDERNK